MDADELDLLREAREAIINGFEEQKYPDNMLICECLCISVGDIRNCIKKSKLFDIKFLKEELMLGSGCSSCTKTFSAWKTKI